MTDSISMPKASKSARGMWLALGFVLSLFLVPYFVGCTLPDDYDGSVQTELAIAPQVVWDAILDHHEHPLSGAATLEVVDLAPTTQGPAWEERMERARLVVETRSMDVPSNLERVAVDEANGVESTWTYELEPQMKGTRLVVRQHLRIVDAGFSTPYFRLFTHYLDFASRAPHDHLESIVRSLGVTDIGIVIID